MRVWDIHPGYLNRQSLLGEHREIHGMISILANGKKGYSHHPETVRWKGRLWAARRRHDQLVAEMKLRGYRHHSRTPHRGRAGRWPGYFVDPPGEQFQILEQKYIEREPGRIPLPASTQILWAQHKYSVLARDPELARQIGRRVSGLRLRDNFDEIAAQLVKILRVAPTEGRLQNSLDHMWGHVSQRGLVKPNDPAELLARINELAFEQRAKFIVESTAMSDLAAWV